MIIKWPVDDLSDMLANYAFLGLDPDDPDGRPVGLDDSLMHVEYHDRILNQVKVSLDNLRVHVMLLKCVHTLKDSTNELGQVLQFFILHSYFILVVVNLQDCHRLEFGSVDGNGQGVSQMLQFQLVQVFLLRD